MRPLKALVRSPIAWLTLVLGALFVAPATTSAQEATVLTAERPSASGTITGNPGMAFVPYTFDYKAGQYVSVQVTPTDRAQWWNLTASSARGRASTQRGRNNGFWGEVWGPTGKLEDSDLRKEGGSGCLPGAAGRGDGRCVSFRVASAPAILPYDTVVTALVRSTAPISVPYTIAARRLGAPRATNAGAPPSGEGPMMNVNNAQTGTVVGKRDGGNSVYYTYMHPGGMSGNSPVSSEFYMFITPNLPAQFQGQVGINVYRGTVRVGGNGTNRGGVSAETMKGPDSATIGGGASGHLRYDLDYRGDMPELLTVEIFNFVQGQPVQYAIHVK